jgi:hypothetical protein
MDPIDQLLQTLNPIAQPPSKTSAGQSHPGTSSVTAESIESLLQRLGESQKQQVRDRLLATPSAHPQPVIIPELQTYANEIAEAERILHDRHLKEQQVLQKQQQQELRSQALDWLKMLDPLSTEGLWFNSFAEGNGDRLEVAIEYLAALQAIDPNQTTPQTHP